MENMENKKTIGRDTFNHVAFDEIGQSCYWFNKEEGVLEEVTIEAVRCSFITGSITYSLNHRGSIRSVIAKNDFDSEFELKLYTSEKNYINGSYISYRRPLSFWNVREEMKQSFNECVENNVIKLPGFTLKDGEVVELDAMDLIAFVTLSYKGRRKFHPQYSIEYVDGKTPDFHHIYRDKETLFNYESVKVMNNDGTEKETKAYYKSLRLTDEQKNALERFIEARNELKKVDIGLVFDYETYDFYAINAGNIESMMNDEAEHSVEDYLKEGVLRVDSIPGFMRADLVCDGYFNSDYQSLLCKLKK